MGETVAVLVVPAEGDPGGLLSPGAPVYAPDLRLCGWTASDCGATVVLSVDGDVHADLCDGDWWLILRWDGALVPEGWDRARRVGISVWNNEPTPDLGTVLVCGTSLCDRGWGSRTVRLARVDGRLVEVP